MQKRSYNQACSLAVAMDLIGERWTWLILRGLLTGPKRFGELLDQLPGIGTNLLASRLKSLVANGLAEKDGAGRQAAYRLTAAGEELRPITHALIRWGRQFPLRAKGDILSQPEWDMLAIEAAYVPEHGPKGPRLVELTLTGFVFHLRITPERCRAITGPTIDADLEIISDTATLQAIGQGKLAIDQAKADNKLKLGGNAELFSEFIGWFGGQEDTKPTHS